MAIMCNVPVAMRSILTAPEDPGHRVFGLC